MSTKNHVKMDRNENKNALLENISPNFLSVCTVDPSIALLFDEHRPLQIILNMSTPWMPLMLNWDYYTTLKNKIDCPILSIQNINKGLDLSSIDIRYAALKNHRKYKWHFYLMFNIYIQYSCPYNVYCF